LLAILFVVGGMLRRIDLCEASRKITSQLCIEQSSIAIASQSSIAQRFPLIAKQSTLK
jgi:hypothetical protein